MSCPLVKSLTGSSLGAALKVSANINIYIRIVYMEHSTLKRPSWNPAINFTATQKEGQELFRRQLYSYVFWGAESKFYPNSNVVVEYMMKKYGSIVDSKPLNPIRKSDQLYYWNFRTQPQNKIVWAALFRDKFNYNAFWGIESDSSVKLVLVLYGCMKALTEKKLFKTIRRITIQKY